MTHHPAVNSLLRFFEYDHLPPHLADVSAHFHVLAHKYADDFEGPEVAAGLRKLLEAKDCFVRCAVIERDLEVGGL